ncbi:hypothetical protein ACFE04_012426 [Oxalis oulophora]
MLHKSFKSAKCKTSLKLAASRIKLMKNKRDAQAKQLKRELAALLESGQEQTARIRVEHVVREEKMIGAYELIEIYCELIVARLPMIESQKTCPIDLKEAIASVIFASPRCADIPELADVRKHFTAKYGKEFVSAAVDMRPNCGVGRLLVEKLSVVSPDGPTKIKILSAIAEEHNIKWDPKAFGEKDQKPPIDLLGGPATFAQASYEMPDHPCVQRASNFDDNGRFPPRPDESPNVHRNSYDHNARSQDSQSAASTNAGVRNSNSSSQTHSEAGPSGDRNQDLEFRQSYSRGSDASTFGGQNWNMNFKDATAAAQAAAESAERASMAARAAAELSTRENISRQHSTQSQKSSSHGFRNENPQIAKVQKDDALGRNNSRMQYDSFRGDEEENQSRVSQSPSIKSSTGFVDEHNTSVNNFEMAGRYSGKNQNVLDQSGTTGQLNSKKQPSGDDIPENFHSYEDVMASRQSSRASSRSHSSNFDDDHVVSNENHGNMDNPFADDNRLDVDEKTHTEISHVKESVVFDDYESDDDHYKFDLVSEHRVNEFEYGFSPPRGKLPFLNTLSQGTDEAQKSNSQTYNSSVFSTNVSSPEAPKTLDNLPPSTFDDSDGPSSESEGEQDSFRPVGSKDQSALSHEQNITSRDSEQRQADNHKFSSSSFTDKPESEFGYGDGTIRKSSLGKNSQKDKRDSFNNLEDSGFSRGHDVMDDFLPNDDELLSESSLNFGTLTGGLRNKNFKRPPYIKDSIESTPFTVDQSDRTVKASVSIRNDNQKQGQRKFIGEERKKTATSVQATYNDDSGNEIARQIFNSNEKPYGKVGLDEEIKRPASKTSIQYFDSDGDSEEEISKGTPSSSARPDGTLSRRTKATPVSSRRNTDSRTAVLPQKSVTPDYSMERKTSSGNSYSTETQKKIPDAPERPEFLPTSVSESVFASKKPSVRQQAVSDYSMERKTSSESSYTSETQHKIPDISRSSDSASQFVLESKRSSSQEERSRPSVRQQAVAESKKPTREEYKKLPVREQPSNSPAKTMTAGRTETSRTGSSSRGSPPVEKEKVAHVHPKLPDYDSFAAHFQSLRENHK